MKEPFIILIEHCSWKEHPQITMSQASYLECNYWNYSIKSMLKWWWPSYQLISMQIYKHHHLSVQKPLNMPTPYTCLLFHCHHQNHHINTMMQCGTLPSSVIGLSMFIHPLRQNFIQISCLCCIIAWNIHIGLCQKLCGIW